MSSPLYIYTKSYRNPTSNVDGYKTILGTDENIEIFPHTVTGIAIKVSDNSVYVQLSNDGVSYDNKILMESDAYKNDTFTLSYMCKAVKFSNVNTSGSFNGKYQLLGFEV